MVKETKQGRKKRPLSLILAVAMIAQMVLPAFAAEEPAQEEEQAPLTAAEQYEYVEVKSAEELTSDDTYAIVYTADGSTAGPLLYHKDAGNFTDQVTANIVDSKLILAENFSEETQTWVLTGDTESGYTVKSCSGTNMYLNMDAVTAVGSKVPVSDKEQSLTISAVEGGFSISRMAGEQSLNLAHSDSGQYYVDGTPCTMRLFKKTLVDRERPVVPTEPLTIPGYTRVTDGALDPTKVYMIAAQDDKGDLYAFYPDRDNMSANPGNAINPKGADGAPAGSFVANLTVANGEVTAKHAAVGNKALDMADLHFTLEQIDDKWAIKFKNDLYLAIENTSDHVGMLKDTPVGLTVTANSISNEAANRALILNVVGDSTEFKPHSGFTTNFWGPGPETQGIAICLFTKDGETVVPPAPTVNKTVLKNAINKANELKDNAAYTQESRDYLLAALTPAQQELDRSDSTLESVKTAVDKLNWAIQALVPEKLAPNHPNPATGTTKDQPFINDVTGSSHTFRIPALIKLKDGSLAAGIDARWDKCPDGYGIDNVFSISGDNGENWNYNFPNYFNDSTDAYNPNAAAFIDPVMVQDQKGTIYCMVDVFPGGHYIFSVDKASGYINIEGKNRMVLYTGRSGQNNNNYAYYVGEYVDKFAPVIPKGQGLEAAAAYYLDDHFNLYTAEKKPMYCPQIGSDQFVQQNVFYANAELHVRNATYLWLVTSENNGQTWSAPTIINPMVLESDTAYPFYGAGPGAGLCLTDGTIMLPCYESGRNQVEHASFIYKNPNEDTWHRSENATTDQSSESALVQLDENTVRHFYRNYHSVVCYTDHTRVDGTWKAGSLVEVPGVSKTQNNQVSAIRYSRQVNGKDVILMSTAATGTRDRQNGKIYAFSVNNDAERTMNLIGAYEVTKPGVYYGYSSLTEMNDGNVALLYEDGQSPSFLKIPAEQIIQGFAINNKQNFVIPLYSSVENTEVVPTAAELAQFDKDIVKAELVNGRVKYTGVKIGTTSITTAAGITITIKVEDPSSLVDVAVMKGQTKEIAVDDSAVTMNTNPQVADAQVKSITHSATVINGAKGHEGTNKNYTGTVKPLSGALYQFSGSDGSFQITGKTENGTKVWVSTANIGTPSSKTPETITVTANPDGTFYFQSVGYLYFWRDGEKVGSFDRNSGPHDSCKFKLYRPAEADEKSSSEIPGYVQIKTMAEIQNGSFYLIAATVGQDTYVLRPSVESGAYAQALKVDKDQLGDSTTITSTERYLEVTGLDVGYTDIGVGGTVYRVTVTASQVVNREKLQSAVTRAEALDGAVFQDTSWSEMQTALTSAKQTLADMNANDAAVTTAADRLTWAIQALVPKNLAPERPDPDHGVTKGQPFPAGVPGKSNTFRIPALTTLDNGWVAAAIDARWNRSPDGDNIDTLFSVSKDNGRTWEYSFPNYFNDATDYTHDLSTAFIDPVMVQGKDGTIYLMVDLFPAGHYIATVANDTGYREVNGTQRLVLYTSLNQNADNWSYYVGEFEGKFAPVIAKGETTGAAYYVDDHYYLYNAQKQPMYCQQLGSEQYVRQNVFYYNAELHVRNATYLWLITSKDHGKTWSAPTIMNPMVRPQADGTTHRFYGVGPGAGLCLTDGTILLPCYTNTPEKSSFIYKNPGETVWHRSENATTGNDWSSENVLVQIDDHVVREFCRDGHNVVRYTDHIRDPQTMIWKAQKPVRVEGVSKTTANQVSAIRYSKPVNGQDVILVSTAATGTNDRQNGKIYAFSLNQDPGRTMNKIGEYEVTAPGVTYGYSSITQQEDGSIGLIYEDTFTHGTYLNIQLGEIIPNAVVEGGRTMSLPLYETMEDIFHFDTLPTEAELAQLNSSIVKAEIRNGKVFYTGLKAGTTSYVTGGVTVTIKVTEPSNIENLTMNIGETKEIAVDKGQLTNNTNSTAVNAEVIVNDQSFVVRNGAQGHEGENAGYAGTLKSLSNALYQFNGNSTDGFQIIGKTENGTKVWVSTAVNYRPSSKTPETAVLTENSDGTFFLKLSGGYLHFYRNGKNHFDRVNDTTNFVEACKFKLYRPAAESEQSSTEIPGYIQVTQLSDVKDGGFYLIVAAVGQNNHFVLRPSLVNNNYSHALKVDLAAGNQTTTVENKYYTLKLTAKSAGTADVMVDGQIYRVTVPSNANPDYVSPDITENPDGSVTQTEKKPDGTVVETTKFPNGDKVVAETKKDGTVTTTETRKDGTVVETVTDKHGSTTAQITVPNNVDSVTVTVPTQSKPTSGTVAVMVKPDGTKEVIRKSMTAENGVVVPTDSSIKVEIVDNTKRFEDTKGHWAQDAIDFVTSRELYAGTGANTFSPNQAMSRGMLAVVLYNRESNPATTQNAMFHDVQNGTWYSEAVAWAVEQKIVSGYGDGKFGPDDQITREQLAVMLYQYAGAPAVNGGESLNFADADQISSYAQTAVRWAVENGIINGGDGNRVAPKAPATRAQVAAMMMNFCKNEMN